MRALRSRLGQFWWWTLMVFLACRAADAANLFVGLWLVPKYIGASELGAVMPLANMAGLLAIPLAAFATAFRNEVSRLAITGDFGRLKTLLRSIFISAGVFMVIAAVAAKLLLPPFLERIRIEQGSLAIVITLAALAGALSPVFVNTLQALGRFKEISLIQIVGAPVRLLTMLVAMPFRPLSGYFTGQGASPSFNALASVWFLRKELSVPSASYWTGAVVRRFAGVWAAFLVAGLSATLCSLAETTAIRQYLSEADGAGYYVASRFSEAATFLSATVSYTVFPYAAKLGAGGGDTRPLVLKAWAASAVFCLAAASPFLLFGRWILSFVPGGAPYGDYWWAVPVFAAIGAMASFTTIWTTVQTAGGRFGYIAWLAPLELAYCATLAWAASAGLVRTLGAVAAWMAAAAVARAAAAAVHMVFDTRRRTRPAALS